MTQQPTPIEDRAMRAIHNAAFDAARTKGADFACATQIGFAATDAVVGKDSRPAICNVCAKRGVRA
jgi:hypothetical protein